MSRLLYFMRVEKNVFQSMLCAHCCIFTCSHVHFSSSPISLQWPLREASKAVLINIQDLFLVMLFSVFIGFYVSFSHFTVPTVNFCGNKYSSNICRGSSVLSFIHGSTIFYTVREYWYSSQDLIIIPPLKFIVNLTYNQCSYPYINIITAVHLLPWALALGCGDM